MTNDKKCLITGGAGFIGSHLTGEALARGLTVVVLDNLSTGSRENLAPYLKDIEFVNGDIRDRDLVFRLARGVDLVFHQAALTSVTLSVEQPLVSAEINDIGTLNVFEAARSGGARRVVYASSSAVYGDVEELPIREGVDLRPFSPYAAHKLLGEYYATMFGGLYGLEVVSLRYFNVFGPRQDPSSPYSGVISIFLERFTKGQQPVVYGDGQQTRDFIYVKDVVRANFLAGEAPSAAGQAFNVGTGSSVTINETLSILERLVPTDNRPDYAPPRPGDILHSRADVTLARELLGFEAQTSFAQGLAHTLEWFRSTVA